ncbi:hypothetical protein [Yersinia aldovae]|uniref:Uncharacterized protein n=1 Tax=Yersinia aldovae TaxID=29483 RepID=A0A0T9TM66_YERAL|nr:hypothetical protein [Yersinia aldovae]EEP95993.1 hypothetical protein yaldo0001_2180 [Yersinia aldovae ATCC 35236]CNJ68312.1 Uncharacterised protein [Yersinia aldovae]CNK91243.1 Uncharacterised protein [Yersinia aldovae]CNL60026.1 Uncharacterised protein [Yersinia aldovae]
MPICISSSVKSNSQLIMPVDTTQNKSSVPIKKVKQRMLSFLHPLAKSKLAETAIKTTQDIDKQLSPGVILGVKEDIANWLQNYMDSSSKHKNYLNGYTKKEDIGQYIKIESMHEKDTVIIQETPDTLKKITNLIKQLLEGHSKNGSLYKELKKVMTSEHTLGKLFSVDKSSSIVTKIAHVIIGKNIKIEIHNNQTTASPSIKSVKSSIPAPRPEDKSTQVDINKLKAEIEKKYDPYIELAHCNKLLNELLLMYIQQFGYSSPINTNGSNLPLLRKEGILAYNDYDLLKSEYTKLDNTIQSHENQYQKNMTLLSILTPKTAILPSPVLDIIQQAIDNLKSPPQSLWVRFIRFISPVQVARQQGNSRKMIDKLASLQDLVPQLEKTKHFEHVGNAPWLHNMLRDLLIKAKPEKYSVKFFKLRISLPSPERKAWKTKLKAWGC